MVKLGFSTQLALLQTKLKKPKGNSKAQVKEAGPCVSSSLPGKGAQHSKVSKPLQKARPRVSHPLKKNGAGKTWIGAQSLELGYSQRRGLMVNNTYGSKLHRRGIKPGWRRFNRAIRTILRISDEEALRMEASLEIASLND